MEGSVMRSHIDGVVSEAETLLEGVLL